MRKNSVIMFVLTVFCMGTTSVSAQNLKSILSNVASEVVSKVTGESTVTASSIVGTWKYSEPECKFESDNLLAKAGGTVAESKVESKMSEVCSKFGLSSSTCSYEFDEDGNFTQTINSKTMSGTYTFDESAQTITMKSSTLGYSFTAEVSISGSSMSLLFNADKLLSLLNTTSGILSKSSSSSALSTLSSLSEQYDGLLLGFKLKKK